MSDSEIAALINQRRRQILVHSIIYYRMNDNLIEDYEWANLGKELMFLQEKYPDFAETCVYADDFKDFDCSTGQNLPLDDEWAINKAKQLLAMRNSR